MNVDNTLFTENMVVRNSGVGLVLTGFVIFYVTLPLNIQGNIFLWISMIVLLVGDSILLMDSLNREAVNKKIRALMVGALIQSLVVIVYFVVNAQYTPLI